MIYIDLHGLIEEAEGLTGVRVSLTALSEATGIHRTMLSKAFNHPLEKASSDTLGKIINFFFEFFRHSEIRPEQTDSELMKWITSRLLVVFPDYPGFLELLPRPVAEATKDGTDSPWYAWYFVELLEEEKEMPDLSDPDFAYFDDARPTKTEHDFKMQMIKELFDRRPKKKS